MAIIFDLDETLISTELRQYKVIEHFLRICGVSLDYTFAQYRDIRKKEEISNELFFQRVCPDKILQAKFSIYYLDNIESAFFLEFDSLIIKSEILKDFKLKHSQESFVLLSLRTNSKNSTEQLNKLKLFEYFSDIYFLPHQKENNPKTNKLRDIIKSGENYLFIGDSDTDYVAAKHNNVSFFGVNTGIYTPKLMPLPEKDINELLISII
jgi:phosphoglycolate phosphatase-like HAD superfamily hydrolase